MLSPTKRSLTEQLHSSQLAANNPVNNGVDADLSIRLRNMASRVRKSVSEGYTASVPVSPNASPRKTRLPFTESLPFRSANDALRDVFLWSKDNPTSPSKPSQKRKRAMSESEEDVLLSDEDVDMRFDLDQAAGIPESCETAPLDTMLRPMKPLRNPGQRAAVTRSLPASIFRFSGNTGPPNVITSEHAIEEDWSQETFAEPPSEPLT
ncbi:hypothetical protein AcW1_004335 [Taiwanofungus camphoratus]|nr:hypothetical protein AcW2_006657 [Antrodia cinnamomea]KAI0939245.1 hypothetical protein AcV5_000715 [Antrodia cinnamomea]KAI0952169.1 hypothetical protein AcV7_008054 [Antrodia cinnamomea]KAI0959539.1 hypothetical protein AcW1_004335 [Antrodia cinnamomea]KAI0959540.1 hypothetical protein AcW1_004335 [Antrodia cinnamomea]